MPLIAAIDTSPLIFSLNNQIKIIRFMPVGNMRK